MVERGFCACNVWSHQVRLFACRRLTDLLLHKVLQVLLPPRWSTYAIALARVRIGRMLGRSAARRQAGSSEAVIRRQFRLSHDA